MSEKASPKNGGKTSNPPPHPNPLPQRGEGFFLSLRWERMKVRVFEVHFAAGKCT